MDEIWKVSCVSVAAQVATFALGLLYFHQFPNYFLISNLFVIPGSFVVLILGLLILTVDFVQPLALLLGLLLEWTIKVINFVVFAIEKFPYALIEDVYITAFQCWLLIGILLAIVALIQRRNFKLVYITSALIVIFSFSQWHHFQENVNVRKLMVYNVGGHSATDLIDRGQAFFIADSVLQNDAAKINFHVTPNRVRAGVHAVFLTGDRIQQKFPGCSLVVWKGKSFLLIDKPEYVAPTGLSVDFVVVSNDAVKDLATLRAQVQMKQLILDSSNSRYIVARLLNQSTANSTDVYSVQQQGAFELNI
jgi:competence protein ComEC